MAAVTASVPTLHRLADALLVAELSGRPIRPPSEVEPALTVDDAYAIQAINVRSRERDARCPVDVVGHKIGLTSRAMQEQLGVDRPDFGVLYRDRVHRTGARIATQRLIAPRIEPELAFVLAADLEGPGVTAAHVLAATAAVVPALEVIDSRVADWRISLVDTIADNASCHCAVLGADEHPPAAVDLAGAAVALRVDGAIVQEGTGAAVLGDPALAVAWLADALAEHGAALRAGHVVLSGSMTAAVPFTAGAHVVADFGPLGVVEARAA
jgi:2-oxopent-4-enoate hydratase